MSEKLDILICGAGIAGLCSGIALAKLGHRVTILERARALSPVGAGIHVPPNATLLLQNWGILDRFREKAIEPAGFNFRRYEESSILASSAGKKAPKRTGQTPYWSMRRADYQQILAEAAADAGCEFRLGQQVVSIDENAPSVTVKSGEVFQADIIVAADGIKSQMRQLILPEDDVAPILQPLSTYRAWAPREPLLTDPSVAALLDQPATNVWLGPSRHVIIYPAEDDQGKIYAINGTFPDRNESAGEWNKSASTDDINQQFHEFDPVLKKVLSQARDAKSWALAEIPRLRRWTSKSGKIVLIGDAAHGMLQFLAQGAAMATEDAGALAECIRRIKSKDDIPEAMRLYERSRKWRCEKVQAQARRNGEFIHMPNGEEQEHRDRKMAGKQLPTDQEVDTGPLLDAEFTAWLYSHDVIEQTNRVLDAAGL